jgi:nicotinamide N-methyltransferase
LIHIITPIIPSRGTVVILGIIGYNTHDSYGSEFKEAFPAGRFRPLCKIQAKRGGASTVVADTIKPPNWWHSTRIIQAFDAVLQDKMKRPSLFKRISSLGIVKRPPRLSAAEQLVQLSIRKRATAFVDARDDLETKIGRLSRRLNFLMTESDLWRDKFVTFEQYAEKLSLEANELRSKINKEQRETKRLSGLVTMTAVEKTKLQNRKIHLRVVHMVTDLHSCSELKETEGAHREALVELQKMRETMDTMEQERAEMVAEVEAQIEKALASMAVDIDDESDEYDSQPGSRVSSRPGSRLSRPSSRTSRSRRTSDAGVRMKQLRSFATESTLVDSYDPAREEVQAKLELSKEEVIEEEDEAPSSPTKKRFSASGGEGQHDGMTAVDEGISERSDRIAQKVLQIQQKVTSPLDSSIYDLALMFAWGNSWRMRSQPIVKDSGRPGPAAQKLRAKARRSCPALALAKPRVWQAGCPKVRENVATPSRPAELRGLAETRSTRLAAGIRAPRSKTS